MPLPHEPQRTCVGCRRTDSRSALVRVVLGPGDHDIRVVQPDPRAVLPGRGAWLHPSQECLALALRRRAFGRALRHTGALDTGVLLAWFDTHTVESRTIHPSVMGTESGFDADEHPMSTQQ
ncbi:MAG: YlxR family protein [Tetrasphaera sp.]|nr:YlxR family protein [Tetrasphaera sp.]